MKPLIGVAAAREVAVPDEERLLVVVRSSSETSSMSQPGLRLRRCHLYASISPAAASRKSFDSASPDSSRAESIRIVTGLVSGLPSTTLLSSGSSPSFGVPVSTAAPPAIQS